MLHIPNTPLEIIVSTLAGIVLLFLGFQTGQILSGFKLRRHVSQKEQELFTTQKGFKTLYEQELSVLRAEKDKLQETVKSMTAKVEEYRKKAAGLGGLFNSGGKRADAMYALLLENEALEEALYSQNEKLRQERTDSLKEQLRATSYRRVLMSQLLNDERIKDYVAEIINDEKRLPQTQHQPPSPMLPAPGTDGH
jgi:chromosome segregation ATPase